MTKIDESKEIGIIIAHNLKEIRKNKDLSLDALSNMSGVSKSMLGQIERGESSPTITTLWKIATALHISFTSLLEETKKTIEVIDNMSITPLYNDGDLFKLYPTFPFETKRSFEMLYIELEPGCVSQSEAHELGTEEYVIVYEGTLEITIDEVNYILPAASAIRYDANQNHVYRNKTNSKVKLCMVIHYK